MLNRFKQNLDLLPDIDAKDPGLEDLTKIVNEQWKVISPIIVLAEKSKKGISAKEKEKIKNDLESYCLETPFFLCKIRIKSLV